MAASLGLGYLVNANWLILPSYVKVATATIPLLAAGYVVQTIRIRSSFDPFLQRKKMLLKQKTKQMPPLVTYLEGEGVDKANDLLYQLIRANEDTIPGLKHTGHQWQVLVAKEEHLWLDTTDDGKIMCCKNILTNMSRNELAFMMGTLVAHVLAKHKLEVTSYVLTMHQLAAVVAWYYSFNAPVLYSYPVDMSSIFVTYYLLSYALFQHKFRKLCVEADEIGLRMCSAVGVTEKDAISMMQKLIQFRDSQPLPVRMRGSCHYKHRIAVLNQRLADERQTHQSSQT